MLGRRSLEPERIDTGDYTAEEYSRFLREIAFINRFLGDANALRRGLLRPIVRAGIDEFSVLDVGCGSGQLLAETAKFASANGIRAKLVGLDLNPISARTATDTLADIKAAAVVRADAFRLPFADRAFDYAISSLFFHHLSDQQAVAVLAEMKRVSRLGVCVIDLRRSAAALLLYKIFCTVFRISPLVRHDGSLSIRRSFRTAELRAIAARAGITAPTIHRSFPFRLWLHISE